jgi:hypothetical protein
MSVVPRPRLRSDLGRALLLAGTAAALLACGGGSRGTRPDESRDLGSARRPRARSGVPAGPSLIGTRWSWTESSCTEGPLDLRARGFAQELRVLPLDRGRPGFSLVVDQTFALEQCSQTVFLEATPTSNGEFRIEETVRVAVPSTPACEGAVRPDPPRPGEVRLVDGDLEVLIQRSNWCRGFEVRFAYQPLPLEPLRDEQVLRRYVAYFNLRDAEAIGSLFAETGSLVDPFLRNEFGEPTRHEGREAVVAWYRQAFAGLPWVALRLVDLSRGRASDPNTAAPWVADWEYMDPRLAEPFGGRNTFTVAAGELFETQFELTRPPPGAVPEPQGRPRATR